MTCSQDDMILCIKLKRNSYFGIHLPNAMIQLKKMIVISVKVTFIK